MDPRGNFYLIGMMGAGKTTIGRQLAHRLGRRFVDCDQEIERRTGVRVPVIFEIEGEAGFRRRESLLLQSLAQDGEWVVATGGGIVLDPANRACMARSGLVIYLDVPPAILYERTRNDRNRPLLQVPDPRRRIEELYAQRDPLYREIAHLIVHGGRGGTANLTRQLEKEILSRCAA